MVVPTFHLTTTEERHKRAEDPDRVPESDEEGLTLAVLIKTKNPKEMGKGFWTFPTGGGVGTIQEGIV